MTLIEVMVAMALFLILITASISVLLVSLRTTEVNRDRVGASNLAGRELEIVRDQFNGETRGPDTITDQGINENPLPTKLPGEDIVLDNVHYTVTRTATWSTVGGAAVSVCDDGTDEELAFLRIDVSVNWSRNTGNPITMTTILTPPKGTYSTTSGHIGVKLIDREGQPLVGHLLTAHNNTTNVDVTKPSSNDGCTVFAHLPAGVYTVSVDDDNYVGMNAAGPPNPNRATLTATVAAGQMFRGSISYDKAAQVNVTFVTLTGTTPAYNLPTVNDIPLTFANQNLLPAHLMIRTGTGDVRFLPDLWPFDTGYELWAGDCLDADPAFTEQTRSGVFTATPGNLSGAPVDLAPLTVTGVSVGTTVYADHNDDTSCQSGDRITLGKIPASGTLYTSAPYGQWTITNSSRSRTDDVTLVRGDPPVNAWLW